MADQTPDQIQLNWMRLHGTIERVAAGEVEKGVAEDALDAALAAERAVASAREQALQAEVERLKTFRERVASALGVENESGPVEDDVVVTAAEETLMQLLGMSKDVEAARAEGKAEGLREGFRSALHWTRDVLHGWPGNFDKAVDAYLASRTPSQEDRPNGASVASDWAQYRHEVGRVFRATAEAIDMVGAIAGGCDADQRKWIQAAWDTLMEFRNIRSPLGDERRYVERSANRSANSTQRPHKEGEQS
mgnify:CR=1 FL=1